MKRKRLADMRNARTGGADAPAEPIPVPAATVRNAPVQESKTSAMDSFIADVLAGSRCASPVPPAAAAAPAPVVEGKSNDEKIKSFSIVKCNNVVDIAPVEVVTYDKGCQTEEEDMAFLPQADSDAPTFLGSDQYDKRHSRRIPNPLKPTLSWHSDGLHTAQHIANSVSASIGQLAAKEHLRAKALSDEERGALLSDAAFMSFLGSRSLFVERALEQNVQQDILKDYALDSRNQHQRTGTNAFEVIAPYEDDHVRGRPVMDVKYSGLQNDLFLVAYGARTASSGNITAPKGGMSAANVAEDSSPGLVYVWSSALHKRPEFRFQAMSAVLTAAFHISEPHVVLGGCYNGQIVLWDMRLNKTLPAYRSSLTGKGHKHPVYAMSMLASSSTPSIPPNNELITLSIDGLLCHWDVSQLSDPVIMVNILLQSVPKNTPAMNMLASPQALDAVNPTSNGPLNTCCMATVTTGDSHIAHLVIGSGSGHMLSVGLPVKPSAANVKQCDAHFGLITALHAHPSSSTKYRYLLLTCALDWSIRLWHLHLGGGKPLLDFVNTSCDYFAAVQWCPIHPAVFASITSGGRLAIWNIARSTTEAVDSINVLSRDSTDEVAVAPVSSAPAVAAALLMGSKSTSNVLMLGATAKNPSNPLSLLQKTHTMVSMPTSAAAAAAHPSTPSGTVALCRLNWTADGQSLILGDSMGNVHCVRVHGSVTNLTPQDEHKLEMVLLAATESVVR